LIAALPTPAGRHSLRNGELAWHDLQGNTQRRQVESAAAAIAVLRDVFGIELAGLYGLEQRLARMAFLA
jgi:arylamine N-acetyltransferase